MQYCIFCTLKHSMRRIKISGGAKSRKGCIAIAVRAINYFHLSVIFCFSIPFIVGSYISRICYCSFLSLSLPPYPSFSLFSFTFSFCSSFIVIVLCVTRKLFFISRYLILFAEAKWVCETKSPAKFLFCFSNLCNCVSFNCNSEQTFHI